MINNNKTSLGMIIVYENKIKTSKSPSIFQMFTRIIQYRKTHKCKEERVLQMVMGHITTQLFKINMIKRVQL